MHRREVPLRDGVPRSPPVSLRSPAWVVDGNAIWSASKRLLVSYRKWGSNQGIKASFPQPRGGTFVHSGPRDLRGPDGPGSGCGHVCPRGAPRRVRRTLVGKEGWARGKGRQGLAPGTDERGRGSGPVFDGGLRPSADGDRFSSLRTRDVAVGRRGGARGSGARGTGRWD